MKIKEILNIMITTLFLLFINTFKLSIPIMLLLFIIKYILFFYNSYKKYNNFKSLFFSSEFIMMTLFFIYSLPGPMMFILDNYTPRIYFFRIDTETIMLSLKIYLNIFCFTDILISLSGGINYYNKELKKNVGNYFFKIDIFDIISILLLIYFYYLHFRNGIVVLSSYFQDTRIMIQSNIHNLNSYIYLYFIVYSFVNFYKLFYLDNNCKKSKLKIILFLVISIMFWGLSILTDRRNLLQLLLLLLLLFFNHIKKVKVNTMLKIFCILIILLFMSFLRSGEKFNKNDINNVIHLSLGEFIYVSYVTDYYINNQSDLLYGRTYFYDTITSFIPRSVNPNKPIPLGEKFKLDANTNVAYAFNPVAEGIINFGTKFSVIFVPFVLLFFIKISYFLGRRNILIYYLVISEYPNFIRGTFSVTIFTLITMIILVKFMINKKEILYK